jgi:hypothetical protein
MSNDRMRLKNKLVRMWKKAGIAEFKVPFRHLRAETETRETLQSEEPQCLSRDLNASHPERK